MPITRTPIVDDDGSGTTGTILDNAWKQEFYDQIDGVAGSAPLLLRHATGQTTVAGQVELDHVAMPALAPTDEIRVTVTAYLSAAAGALYIAVLGQMAILRLDDLGTALGAGFVGTYSVILRMNPANGTQLLAFAEGSAVNAMGAPTAGTSRVEAAAFTSGQWGIPWNLQIYMQANTGTIAWSWTVYRM